MRDRNPSIRRSGNCRGHPRHDFELNSSRSKHFRFFPTSPKNEGIASLQSHNDMACTGSFNQETIDGLLLRIFPFASSSDIDALGSVPGMDKEAGIGEIIVEHHVGLLKTLFAPKGQQARVSGTGSDQIHLPLVSSYHVHVDP